MTALPRLAAAALAYAASVMPVTVVTGARQTGKSTLVRDLAPAGERPYFTLDDLDVLEQAIDAPDDLVVRAERLTLDEVQRAPQLLLAVKRAVDRGRRAGRFLLIGSANLLLMHQVSETLAGRATYRFEESQ
jgi:predicted AAA+ superfamily ATPase